MKKTIVEINKTIKPDRIKINGKFKKIKNVTSKFIITKYFIYLTDDDERIDKIVLENPHPNSNPRNNIFCIPYDLKDKQLDETIIPTLNLLLGTFNFDDCFFQPWEEINIE